MAKYSARKLGSGRRNRWLKALAPNVAKTELGSIRVLIDTNVWYSAILYGGKLEEVVRLCKQHCTIVSSHYLLTELLVILKESGAPYRWCNDLERILKQLTLSVEPPDFSGISRDPNDDPIIAAAISGNCGFLITSDKDLIELQTLNELVILRPSDFLELSVEKFN